MEIQLLSVIIPIYKKEKTIQKELEKIIQILEATPYNFEIIGVVDGTSLDQSFKRAREFKHPKLRIYGYKKNHGKGQAVRYGMKKAKGDVITYIDSGGDIDPQSLIMLLEHMKWYKADIITGSKLHSASIIRNYPFFRRLLSFGYYLIIKFLFRLKVRDIQTGLKAYRGKVVKDVIDRMVLKKFAFEIELLAVANRLGYKRIYDAPVVVNFDMADTSFKPVNLVRSISDFLLDTAAVWYRMYILKYYDNGRQRVKEYNSDLDMYVNTGAMTGRKQVLIEAINGIATYFVNKK